MQKDENLKKTNTNKQTHAHTLLISHKQFHSEKVNLSEMLSILVSIYVHICIGIDTKCRK